MWKVLTLVFLAIASFLTAGFELESNFSWGWAIPIVIGIGLLLWAAISLLNWSYEFNLESNILYVLETERGYEVIGQTTIQGLPIQILMELDTKRRRIALIEPDRNSGFVEVRHGDKTFWVPPGKALVHGCAEDCVFTLTKSKEPINWAH